MSNMKFLGSNDKDWSDQVAVRRIVAERAGREWSLFLDRDGVLNRQIVGDYVRSWQDFEWLPMAQEALTRLRGWAPHLVVVTNQQGISAGLMSAQEVTDIHNRLQEDLAAVEVSIDSFQVCPHLASAGCGCRKPQTGLITQWLDEHPKSEPSLSIVVGDSKSDLELARNVAVTSGGCISIQIGQLTDCSLRPHATFNSLWDFALAIEQAYRRLRP